MAKGYIKLHRKIEETLIWVTNEPFDKRSAWVHLLLKANYTDAEAVINNKVVLVKRGEFITSEVKLAETWKWDRGKVRRYLTLLEKSEMIIKTAEQRQYVKIEILNYDFYQDNIPCNTVIDNTTTNATRNTTTNATSESLEPQGFEDTSATSNATTNAHKNEQETNISNKYKNTKKKEKIYSPAVEDVWNYYLSKTIAMGKKRVKTSAKLEHINARLEQGFTVEQLKNAIDNVFSDKWMLGENPNNKQYIEIENFMCNAEKVEKWSNKRGDEKKNGGFSGNNKENFTYYNKLQPEYEDIDFSKLI